MDKAAQDNRANQCNPNHAPTGPGKVQHSFVHGSPQWNPIQFYNKVIRSKGNIYVPCDNQLCTVYRSAAFQTIEAF